MNIKLTVLLFLCSVGAIFAQQKRWTLEECVIYAEQNNLSIQLFELDLENAKIDRSDAIGNLLPNANGSINFQSSTGLSFDPTNNQPVNTTQNSSSGNIGSNINIFDGLANYNRLKRAKLSAIASQYRLDDLVDDIRLNVAVNYLSVLSNKESLKVFEAQYAATRQDMLRTEELVASGVVPQGDLLEIQATAAGQEQQVVNGENQVLISRIALAQLLQITDYENFDISEEQFDLPPADILGNSPKIIFNKALSFRNDIKFSEASVGLAEKDVEIAKAALYPTLGAFVNYNTRYSDQFFDPITGDLIPFKDQLWINDGISFGAQLSVPIFNGMSTKNNIKRSVISHKQAQLQFEQDKLDLEVNVNQSYVDVKSAAKSFESAQKTMEARSLSYNYAKDSYDAGLLNAFDFSISQARVDNAEAEVIRTKYDYIFRLKILEFYFGIPITLN